MATVVTNGGLSIIPNRMLGGGTEPKYIGWGTGAGTAAVADTTLFSAAAEARVTGTSSRVTGVAPNNTNDTYQVVGTVVSASSQSITNAALFDDPSAGTLFAKGDHSSTPVGINEGIQYTFQVQFKNT